MNSKGTKKPNRLVCPYFLMIIIDIGVSPAKGLPLTSVNRQRAGYGIYGIDR